MTGNADGEVDAIVAKQSDKRGLDGPPRGLIINRPDVIRDIQSPRFESTVGVDPYSPADFSGRAVEIKLSTVGAETCIRTIAAELANEWLGCRGLWDGGLSDCQGEAGEHGA